MTEKSITVIFFVIITFMGFGQKLKHEAIIVDVNKPESLVHYEALYESDDNNCRYSFFYYYSQGLFLIVDSVFSNGTKRQIDEFKYEGVLAELPWSLMKAEETFGIVKRSGIQIDNKTHKKINSRLITYDLEKRPIHITEFDNKGEIVTQLNIKSSKDSILTIETSSQGENQIGQVVFSDTSNRMVVDRYATKGYINSVRMIQDKDSLSISFHPLSNPIKFKIPIDFNTLDHIIYQDIVYGVQPKIDVITRFNGYNFTMITGRFYGLYETTSYDEKGRIVSIVEPYPTGESHRITIKYPK